MAPIDNQNGLAGMESNPNLDRQALEQIKTLIMSGQATPDQLVQEGIPVEVIEQIMMEIQQEQAEYQSQQSGLAGQSVI